MTKADKIIKHFMEKPGANVKVVAAKYGCAVSRAYALRKRAHAMHLANMALSDMLEMPAAPAITVAAPKNEARVSVDAVLNERAQNYGKFIEGAEVMQMTKRLIHNYIEQRGTELAFDQLEAIDMIIHKLGRIVNGNPDHLDNWVDIAGYAQLVADRLKGNVR